MLRPRTTAPRRISVVVSPAVVSATLEYLGGYLGLLGYLRGLFGVTWMSEEIIWGYLDS